MSRCDLPVGTLVTYTQHPYRGDVPLPCTAKIVGRDLHGSKYRLSVQLYAGCWSQPDIWAFPSEVAPLAAAQHPTEEKTQDVHL